MRPSSIPNDKTLNLWYGLGELYAGTREDGRRASALGFAVVCASAALVLLSAPIFGTRWVGPFAAVIPMLAGLLAGAGSFGRRRLWFSRKRNTLRRALVQEGLDADRPAAYNLAAYYDAQLILMRCEYEFLASRGTKKAARSARLFELSFGFTPEDPFECGPLSVAPDAEEMRSLRERWEGRIAARRALEEAPPPLGLWEDAHYRVFPREMTVARELATRSAYLKISCDLFRERRGRGRVPEGIRRRAEQELKEYQALLRR